MKIKLLMIKTIAKLINSVIILVNTELLHIEILNIKIITYLKYSIAKQISMVFYNELNYDYYFIIKELRKKIEENLIVWVKILKQAKPSLFQ